MTEKPAKKLLDFSQPIVTREGYFVEIVDVNENEKKLPITGKIFFPDSSAKIYKFAMDGTIAGSCSEYNHFLDLVNVVKSGWIIVHIKNCVPFAVEQIFETTASAEAFAKATKRKSVVLVPIEME